MPTYSYSASKAAIHQLTRVLAKERPATHYRQCDRPRSVPVEDDGCHPGRLRGGDSGGAPLRRIGRDDDMAGIVVFLASRAGSYVNGASSRSTEDRHDGEWNLSLRRAGPYRSGSAVASSQAYWKAASFHRS